MTTRKHGRPARLSGVFDPLRRFLRSLAPPRMDVFRTAEEPSEAPQAQARPGLPAPERSLVPRESQLPAPLPVRAREMFLRFAPTPEAPAPEPAREEAPQPSLWQAMFAHAEPAAPEEPAGIFRPFRSAEEEPPRAARWAPITVRLPTIVPTIVPGTAGWLPPTPAELAERFRSVFDLPAVFEHVRSVRSTPHFWWALEEWSPSGLPVKIPVMPVVYRAVNLDFSVLFGIPGEVIDSFYLDVRSPEDELRADERIARELFRPLVGLLTEAFEILKPDDLAGGWFTLEEDEKTGQYWLTYLEALIPAPKAPGLPWRER